MHSKANFTCHSARAHLIYRKQYAREGKLNAHLESCRLRFRISCSQAQGSDAVKASSDSSEAKKFPGWDKVVSMRWSRSPWKGTIQSVNQGGAIVSVEGIIGFIPFGEIDPSRLPKDRDAPKDFLVGKSIRAKIVQVNPVTHKCVLSETDQIFKDSREWLKKGAIVNGVITNITNYGAFVSVKSTDGIQHGIYGMIHRSEVSWNSTDGVNDILTTGDEVRVVITEVEVKECRLKLSLKQAQADPIQENLDTLMPLDAATISDLHWEDSGNPAPGLEGVVQELRNEPKVESVEFGRLAEAPRAVSQDLEVWLSKEAISKGYTLVSRAGRSLQEVHVTTSMSRNDMKTLISDVLRRVM